VKIAIAGYRGFLGRGFMEGNPGLEFIPLPRHLLYGNPEDLGNAINGARVVINLAGSPINRRWTNRNRKKIHMSRHGVNRNLVHAINGMVNKPELFVTASAIGIYDHEGVHDEQDCSRGRGFMADVVQEWEEPVRWLLDPSVKSAILRTGMVLGCEGGPLVPFLRITRAGITPVIGSGKQVHSFIHIGDLAGAIGFIIRRRLEGVFNLCAPHPVEHRTFIRILARETGARVTIRIPVYILRILMGQAHELVSEGQHVLPARLLAEGYRFRYPEIEKALKNLIQEH
jgi:uncharacterized protein (TIGR01777 family)